MKRLILLLFLTHTICSNIFASRTIDEVAWVVGDEPILKSDIETEILRMRYNRQKIEGDPYCVIPEQLAIQKLFIAQAKIDSIVVTQSQVDMQVDGRLKFFIQQIGSEEKVEEYFKKPIREIKSELARTIEDQLTVQEMQRSIVGSVEITPGDVRKFYKTMPKDSIPIIPEQVEVQIISISPKITHAEEERIRSRLREYTEDVQSGKAEFSTLAILYSEDRGSAMQGGELGFMSRGKLVPEFADAAFSLYEPGKISRIVQTEFGYHIIQLIERKNDQVNCRHILLIPSVDPSAKAAATARLDSVANDLRLNRFTFEQAVRFFSEDKDTNQNDGTMLNAKNGSSKFEIQELPPDIAKVVYNMHVGEVSEPFTYKTDTGKELVCIVKLKSKVERHSADPDRDFQTLKNMVSSLRNQDLIEKWIKEKQKETYIYINPEYRDCQFIYPGWIKE